LYSPTIRYSQFLVDLGRNGHVYIWYTHSVVQILSLTKGFFLDIPKSACFDVSPTKL